MLRAEPGSGGALRFFATARLREAALLATSGNCETAAGVRSLKQLELGLALRGLEPGECDAAPAMP
jgi:hypothetical protein